MLIEQTIEELRALRLTGMVEALEEQLRTRAASELDFTDRLALLIEREKTAREDRRFSRLLRGARLRMQACVEDIDFRSPRGLDRSVILRLASCEWIHSHQTVLITGATGTGKSYLACALAHSACRQGLSTRYYRFSRMLSDLALARADGSYGKLLEKLAKTQLLLLDDFGLAPLAGTERMDFLVENWHELTGDPTFGDAILDRLVHGSHLITLKGGSMRRRYSSTSDSGTEEEKTE